MHIGAALRCRDHKNQVGGLSVQGVVIHTFRHGHGCQTGFCYSFIFCMGNGNAFTDGGGTALFPFYNSFLKYCLVGNISHPGM